jgi:hypothetical protein
MYPTATRYPGPTNARKRRNGLRAAVGIDR